MGNVFFVNNRATSAQLLVFLCNFEQGVSFFAPVFLS